MIQQEGAQESRDQEGTKYMNVEDWPWIFYVFFHF